MSKSTAPTSRISARRQTAQTGGGPEYSSKRSELIRVAADVFREKGYAPATLNDIAARFGTDRASLYYYVGSKEELFQECIEGILDENIAKAADTLSRDMSPREKLARLVDIIITSQADHYPYMFVYIQENMRQVVSEDALWAQEMVEKTHHLEKYFTRVIADGVADGSFRSEMSTTLMANALFGMMMWTHRWFVPGRKYTAGDLVETFTAILFDGIDVPENGK